jgi:hypothetical protein
MATICRPKTIVLDSSHWVELARDAHSPEKIRRQKAHDFSARLLELGFTILFSWENLIELAAVDDKHLVSQRLAFIASQPHLSWIGALHQDKTLGSTLDVLAAEALIAYRFSPDLPTTRNRARELFIRFGAGTDFIPDSPLFLDMLHSAAKHSADQSKTIMAFKSVKFLKPGLTLGELIRGGQREPEKVEKALQAITLKLFAEAVVRGDAKISNPQERAENFVQTVTDRLEPRQSTRDAVLRPLLTAGIDEDELTCETTIEEISALADFRRKLQLVAEKTGLGFGELKRRVDSKQLPCCVLSDAFERHKQVPNRRNGSDFNDGLLSALALYADVLCVDKRTSENFRRLRQKETRLRQHIGLVVKATDIEDLFATIKREFPK